MKTTENSASKNSKPLKSEIQQRNASQRWGKKIILRSDKMEDNIKELRKRGNEGMSQIRGAKIRGKEERMFKGNNINKSVWKQKEIKQKKLLKEREGGIMNT